MLIAALSLFAGCSNSASGSDDAEVDLCGTTARYVVHAGLRWRSIYSRHWWNTYSFPYKYKAKVTFTRTEYVVEIDYEDSSDVKNRTPLYDSRLFIVVIADYTNNFAFPYRRGSLSFCSAVVRIIQLQIICMCKHHNGFIERYSCFGIDILRLYAHSIIATYR